MFLLATSQVLMLQSHMLIFIDDSGDPGFKLDKGSSAVFVISLVIFDDNLDAEEAALVLKKLRRKLLGSDKEEFKYHKSRPEIKKAFLEGVAGLNFRVRAIAVKKEKIHNNFLRVNKDSFFNYIVMQVLKHHNGTINHAKMRFDKRGEKKIRNELRVYLSNELDNKNQDVFTQLKFVDSKESILIQLADMIAGCIAAYHKEKDKDLYKIVKRRFQDVWEFQ